MSFVIYRWTSYTKRGRERYRRKYVKMNCNKRNQTSKHYKFLDWVSSVVPFVPFRSRMSRDTRAIFPFFQIQTLLKDDRMTDRWKNTKTYHVRWQWHEETEEESASQSLSVDSKAKYLMLREEISLKKYPNKLQYHNKINEYEYTTIRYTHYPSLAYTDSTWLAGSY